LVGIQKVKDFLSDPKFSSGLMIIRSIGTSAYYVLKVDLTPQLADGKTIGYSFQYVTRLTANGPAKMPLAGKVSLSLGKIQEGPIPAPQFVCAQSLLSRLDLFKGAGWETFCLELAVLVQEYKGLDPVVAGHMLSRLMDNALNTTPYKVEEVGECRNRIDRANLEGAEWLDPDDSSAATARARAEQMLKNMQPLQPVVAEIQRRIDSVISAASAYRPIGILLKSSEIVQFGQTPPDGKAYVLWGKPSETPGFVEIGSIQGGKFTGGPEAVAQYPQGSPVFVRVSK
jgi:hypothetical protein